MQLSFDKLHTNIKEKEYEQASFDLALDQIPADDMSLGWNHGTREVFKLEEMSAEKPMTKKIQCWCTRLPKPARFLRVTLMKVKVRNLGAILRRFVTEFQNQVVSNQIRATPRKMACNATTTTINIERAVSFLRPGKK